MCIDGFGYGLEAIRRAGETDEVGRDEPHNGKHGSPAVSDLGLAEERHERLVRFGQIQRIEVELSTLEILSANTK